MSEEATPRAPLIKRMAKIAAFALGALVLTIGAGLIWLDTSSGHRFVANQIAALEFENGLKIEIGAIDGSIYGDMTVQELALSDPTGTFLTADQATMDWRPFAYLQNHVDIRSVSSPEVRLLRAPEFAETPPTDEPLLPDLDITVGKLEVQRFVAEPAVSGEERILTLAGNAVIADRRAQVELEAKTLSDATNNGGDTLAVLLDAVPEKNQLEILLTIKAPEDGVLAALSGLERSLDAKVTGSGDWARWDGEGQASFGGKELANLSLSARDGTFAIRGPAQIARLFEGPTAALMGQSTALDIRGTLNERRIDMIADASSDAMRLNAKGLVDLSDNSFEDFQLAFRLLRPATLAENLSGGGLRALLTLNGAFATPRVAYTLNADQLAINDIGLENLSASGDAVVNADAIMIPVAARAARITGLDTAAGGTLSDIHLNGDLAISGARILSDNMQLRANRIDADLILLADLSTGLYSGAVDGKIDNYRIESVGIFNIETDARLEGKDTGNFALAGKVRARSTDLFSEGVQSFLGGNAVAASDVRYETDGIVRFSNLSVNSPKLRVTGGSGFYVLEDGRLALNANGLSDTYGPLGVQIAGSLTDLKATVTAERPNLGIGLANLSADITTAAGGYRLDARGDTDYGPLTADVLLGTGERLTLAIASANLSGIDFSGTLEQTATGPFVGRLDADGQGLRGLVRLEAQNEFQRALVNLRARGTALPGPAQLRIGTGTVDARIVLYDQPHVVADAEFTQTSFYGLDLNVARTKVDYRNGSGIAKVVAEGISGAPFRVSANANLAPDLWRTAVDGRVRGIRFRTASPARIVPGEGSYELLPTTLDFGRGTMRLSGNYGDSLQVKSRLENVAVGVVDAFIPGLGVNGTATGSLDFEQPDPNAFPRADAKLQIARFTRTTSVSVSEPVDINFVGSLRPDGGESRAVMRKRGSVIGRMVANLKPLSPGAGPWVERLMGAPLSGGVRYNGPAGTLFSFVGQPDQRLSGAIGVAADFSGRVQDPQLAGVIKGNDLTYDNLLYGTRLTNLAIDGQFVGDRLEVESLTAKAGSGTISANGFISLAQASGYPMDLRVNVDKARLASSGALLADATGNFRLTKTAGETALLSGKLTLPESRYQVSNAVAMEVPELAGVRFKPKTGLRRITGDEAAPPPSNLFALTRLNIEVEAPERLYVSGMGLESEWQANLTITGTSAAPRMVGQVNLIRGTLGFAGRSFELTEGRLNFVGGDTINPTLRLVANEDVEDVTVNVNVTGRAYEPQVAFASVPGLPQDEIVSRILFGSSVSNLSAIQAVQLAASLNSLGGSGGGLNPLGKLRSATGVDRLRVLGADETTGRGTALAAGQYLTDDIYVEFITDARGFTATQLEISLTPALSILSQAGGSGQTNINVRYRKNY